MCTVCAGGLGLEVLDGRKRFEEHTHIEVSRCKQTVTW